MVTPGTSQGEQPARRRAQRVFREVYGAMPDVNARAPGRVNLIGEHVDYNDGLVLPAAIDRDVAAALRGRADREVLVVAADLRQSDRFSLDTLHTMTGSSRGLGWRAFVRGVVALLLERGVRLPGAELVIAGDIPRGAGLASSAALELSVTAGLLTLAGATLPRVEMALIGHRAETLWAGVNCGIMDQFVAALGRQEHCIFLDCRSLDYRQVPLPADVRLVATDSGVRRAIRDSAYNRRVKECRDACALLGIASLRDIDADELTEAEPSLPESVRRRARHVVDEIARTYEAALALAAGDVARVGILMNASHASLSTLYQVSMPELDALAEIERVRPGVYGSRLIGAGFGGCTLSLVEAGAVDAFAREVPAAYRAATGGAATVHVFATGDGASAG